jgi:hypothetical protein
VPIEQGGFTLFGIRGILYRKCRKRDTILTIAL